MAVSRAPKRPSAPVSKEISEDRVQEIIRRGGTVAADLSPSTHSDAPSEVPGSDRAAPFTDTLKNVQLRLYASLLEEIDLSRHAQARGRRPASRHAWLLDAVEEKLEREKRKRRGK